MPAGAHPNRRAALTLIVGLQGFDEQRIRTHWVLETGHPRYLWINQAVFVGEGRFRPTDQGLAGFEHRVYTID